MIEIWSGAQTGVDLGALLQALEFDCPIGGFMPADGCNEDGPIPEAVAMHLRRHDRTNPAARTRANVATADAALVIVQDRRRAGATRGTALTIRLCERRCRQVESFCWLAIDPRWHDDVVAAWAKRRLDGHQYLHRPGPLRLLVAGPRASLWPDGEQVARRFVSAIVEEVRRG